MVSSVNCLSNSFIIYYYIISSFIDLIKIIIKLSNCSPNIINLTRIFQITNFKFSVRRNWLFCSTCLISNKASIIKCNYSSNISLPSCSTIVASIIICWSLMCGFVKLLLPVLNLIWNLLSVIENSNYRRTISINSNIIIWRNNNFTWIRSRSVNCYMVLCKELILVYRASNNIGKVF